MIYQWKNTSTHKIIQVFESFDKARAIIVPSIIQGRCTLWVDSLDSPAAVLWQMGTLYAIVGDYGCPEAEALIEKIEPWHVLIAPSEKWRAIVENAWRGRLVVLKRTKLSSQSLTVNHLLEIRNSVPPEHIIQRMDLTTVKSLDKRVHSYIPIFFGGSGEFYKRGIGFCIKDKEKVVSSATTFAPFINEFEMEVNTVNDSKYRRRGLATAVSAALILHALENNLTPHWDAENDISVKLALRLGYSNPETYESLLLR